MSRFLLFFLISLKVYAQYPQGKILDPDPVSGVYISVSKVQNGAIFDFARTSNSGEFTLKKASVNDTLWITVSHLGYQKIHKAVYPKEWPITLKLEKSAQDLSEIVVTPPVIKRNDTTAYKVESYQKLGDKTLADVIQRIPGLEVDLSGKIKYQGNYIEKFYIEGMDLMGGGYGLVNNNINADKVDKVEVLENHQSVRMLDKRVHSDKTSINIKLKNKYTAVIPTDLNLGGKEFLYNAKTTPMIFSPRNQMVASAQANNTGRNLTQNGLGEQLLNVQTAPKPIFSDQRWLFNQSLLGSFNYLTRNQKKTDFKINSSYSSDKNSQDYQENSIFLLPNENEIKLIEQNFTKNHNKPLVVSFEINQNTNDNFFKNLLTYTYRNHTAFSDLYRNADTITQTAKLPLWTLNNEFSRYIKIKKHLLNLSTNLAYTKANQSLQIYPGNYSFNFDYLSLQQKIRKENFLINATTGMIFNFKPVKWSTNLWAEYQENNINSDLLATQSLGKEYTNRLYFNKAIFKLNNNFEKEINQWLFRLSLPLSVQHIAYGDPTFSRKNTLNNAPFEPALNITFKLNPQWKFTASTSRSQTFGDVSSFHYGFMLPNYRTLFKKDAPLPQNISNRNSVGISYINPFIRLNGSLHVSQSNTRYNLINERVNLEDGSVVLTARELENKGKLNLISGNLGYNFADNKLALRYNILLTQTEKDLYLNNVKSVTVLNNLNQTWSLNYFPIEKLSFTTSTQIHSFSSKLNQNNSSKVENYQFRLNAKYNLAKKNLLWVQTETFKNSLRTDYTSFLDAGYRLTFPKKKIDLNLSALNILNRNNFVYAQTDALTQSTQHFELRPLQIMVGLNYSFNL